MEVNDILYYLIIIILQILPSKGFVFVFCF